MSDTPASLLQRLRQPDSRQAWERFVDLYTPLIFFWGVRAGLPAQDAGDLVQDVFATLLTKLPEFDYDRDRSFRAWLRTITLNRWRDLRRRQAVRAHAGSEALEHVAAPEAAEALWEAEYRRYVAGRAVEIMQAEFEARTWQAFWAMTVEGRPAADVAASLGMTPAAVYNAKYRVLCRLREELAGLLE